MLHSTYIIKNEELNLIEVVIFRIFNTQFGITKRKYIRHYVNLDDATAYVNHITDHSIKYVLHDN